MLKNITKTFIKSTVFHQCIDEYSPSIYEYDNILRVKSDTSYSTSTSKFQAWLMLVQNTIVEKNAEIEKIINNLPNNNDFCNMVDNYLDKKIILEFEIINTQIIYTERSRTPYYHIIFKLNQYLVEPSSK